MGATGKLQTLVYDIFWRKVPESDARSVGYWQSPLTAAADAVMRAWQLELAFALMLLYVRRGTGTEPRTSTLTFTDTAPEL